VARKEERVGMHSDLMPPGRLGFEPVLAATPVRT
jgi:hypothetical protein